MIKGKIMANIEGNGKMHEEVVIIAYGLIHSIIPQWAFNSIVTALGVKAGESIPCDTIKQVKVPTFEFSFEGSKSRFKLTAPNYFIDMRARMNAIWQPKWATAINGSLALSFSKLTERFSACCLHHLSMASLHINKFLIANCCWIITKRFSSSFVHKDANFSLLSKMSIHR